MKKRVALLYSFTLVTVVFIFTTVIVFGVKILWNLLFRNELLKGIYAYDNRYWLLAIYVICILYFYSLIHKENIGYAKGKKDAEE